MSGQAVAARTTLLQNRGCADFDRSHNQASPGIQ
jgi:hypothetical protein